MEADLMFEPKKLEMVSLINWGLLKGSQYLKCWLSGHSSYIYLDIDTRVYMKPMN